MSIIEAVVLGIVQGLTEFLPISSSGHLLVLPWLMQWSPGGLVFDVLLHAGTLAALLVYFRGDLYGIWTAMAGDSLSAPSAGSRLAGLIAAGTIPIVLVGAAGGTWVEQELRIPGVAIFNLAFFGLVLAVADWKNRNRRSLTALSWGEAVLIGAAQALALAPGVSRSGITITAALFLGLSRVEAARFSFLLGIPAIAAAAASQVLELAWHPEAIGGVSVPALLIGITSAFVSGFLCIKYFLKFLENGSLLWFSAYRCCLAGIAAYLLL